MTGRMETLICFEFELCKTLSSIIKRECEEIISHMNLSKQKELKKKY